jgi:exonuclease SbcC
VLERLTLRNFQVHEKLDLELDPACTTIVGPTDSGKSAVIRGLRWLCENQPSGMAFVGGHGKAPFASVTLFVDGVKVVRKRGDGNLYKLGKKQFKAFGGKVPDEIHQTLNVGPVNFQGQLDPPFWFLESAGQVSRNLNEIVNLGAIDLTLSRMASKAREASSELKVTSGRLHDARLVLRQLVWVKELDADLTALEEFHFRLEQSRISLSELGVLIESGTALSRRKETLSEATGEAETLLGIMSRAQQARRNVDDLRSRLLWAKRLRESMQEVPDLSELQEVRDKADRIATRNRRFEAQAEEAVELTERLKCLKNDLEAAEEELAQALEGRCPLCGK